ncbi:C40 family peptidase [Corynebacterium occultum]|uniref:C40 family peptidase n=1 Tax=Corynebacterium occultum TaxID=2675219 RepID=UPI001E558704|nr:C40 family peptidase [Corynebacterium occultum]
MGKHRSQNLTTVRRIATASAVAVGATAIAAAPANAVEISVAGSSVNVDDRMLSQIQGLENIPNIGAFIPSIVEQAAPVEYGNAVAAVAEPAAPVQQAYHAPSNGQAIVDAARSKIGSPYGWGATGPSAFDCSGLTSWAYQQAGKSIPRTSQAQAAAGTPVSISDLQPGDIIAYYGGASHVAIYAGNGMMIDALNSGSTVQERPVNYMPIHSAFRF